MYNHVVTSWSKHLKLEVKWKMFFFRLLVSSLIEWVSATERRSRNSTSLTSQKKDSTCATTCSCVKRPARSCSVTPTICSTDASRPNRCFTISTLISSFVFIACLVTSLSEPCARVASNGETRQGVGGDRAVSRRTVLCAQVHESRCRLVRGAH